MADDDIVENCSSSSAETTENASPLFDPATYTPDTIDFAIDTEARQYWLRCFRDLVGKFAAQAAAADADVDGAAERAESYRLDYVRWVDSLLASDEPSNDTNGRSSTCTTNRYG